MKKKLFAFCSSPRRRLPTMALALFLLFLVVVLVNAQPGPNGPGGGPPPKPMPGQCPPDKPPAISPGESGFPVTTWAADGDSLQEWPTTGGGVSCSGPPCTIKIAMTFANRVAIIKLFWCARSCCVETCHPFLKTLTLWRRVEVSGSSDVVVDFAASDTSDKELMFERRDWSEPLIERKWIPLVGLMSEAVVNQIELHRAEITLHNEGSGGLTVLSLRLCGGEFVRNLPDGDMSVSMVAPPSETMPSQSADMEPPSADTADDDGMAEEVEEDSVSLVVTAKNDISDGDDSSEAPGQRAANANDGGQSTVLIAVLSAVAVGIVIAVVVGAVCVMMTLNKAKQQRIAASQQGGGDVLARGDSSGSYASAQSAPSEATYEYNAPPGQVGGGGSAHSGYTAAPSLPSDSGTDAAGDDYNAPPRSLE